MYEPVMVSPGWKAAPKPNNTRPVIPQREYGLLRMNPRLGLGLGLGLGLVPFEDGSKVGGTQVVD